MNAESKIYTFSDFFDVVFPIIEKEISNEKYANFDLCKFTFNIAEKVNEEYEAGNINPDNLPIDSNSTFKNYINEDSLMNNLLMLIGNLLGVGYFFEILKDDETTGYTLSMQYHKLISILEIQEKMFEISKFLNESEFNPSNNLNFDTFKKLNETFQY